MQTKCINDLHVPCGILCMFIFTAQTAIHTHLMNHDYFDLLDIPEDPNLGPYCDKNGAGFGISLVYLWRKYTLLDQKI